MVLELSEQLLNLCDEEAVFGVTVSTAGEVSPFPELLDLSHCLQDASLSCSEGRDLFNLVEVIFDALLQQLSERKVHQGHRLGLYQRPNFLPMLLLHCLVTECSNQVAITSDILDFASGCLMDLVLVVSADLGLELDELALSLFHRGHNGWRILVAEVLSIPSPLLFSESQSDLPEFVPDTKELLELCYLRNSS